MTSQPYFIYSS